MNLQTFVKLHPSAQRNDLFRYLAADQEFWLNGKSGSFPGAWHLLDLFQGIWLLKVRSRPVNERRLQGKGGLLFTMLAKLWAVVPGVMCHLQGLLGLPKFCEW